MSILGEFNLTVDNLYESIEGKKSNGVLVCFYAECRCVLCRP
jgi:hypothetical protein